MTLTIRAYSLELHRTASSIAAESLRGLSESDRERTILFYQRGTRIEVEDADVSEFLTELDHRLAAEGGVVAEEGAHQHFHQNAQVPLADSKADEEKALSAPPERA